MILNLIAHREHLKAVDQIHLPDASDVSIGVTAEATTLGTINVKTGNRFNQPVKPRLKVSVRLPGFNPVPVYVGHHYIVAKVRIVLRVPSVELFSVRKREVCTHEYLRILSLVRFQ